MAPAVTQLNSAPNAILGSIILSLCTLACTSTILVIRDPEQLREILEATRQEGSLPAVAAAVVIGDRIVAASAVGERKFGDATPVTRNDAFELGSITKPLTGTLFGILKEQGVLSWETTIGSSFTGLPEDMEAAYKSVTVRQLLSHTSGLPFQPRMDEARIDGEWCETLFPPATTADDERCTVVDQRRAYVAAAVLDTPCASPGAVRVYSGGGIIVASMAEQKERRSWERLVTELVFKPLRMRTAGFGPMASPPDFVDGPWYHKRGDDGTPDPQWPDPEQYVQARAPVGRNVHSSVIDLAKFAGLHLAGLKGESSHQLPLSADTFRELHEVVQLGPSTPTPTVIGDLSADDCGERTTRSTAGGWSRTLRDGVDIHWHAGTSRGRGHAVLHIVPDRDYATVVMTNVGDTRAKDALRKLNDSLEKALKAADYRPDRLFLGN